METKANYVLIGLFTLVGILGALALLLWLAAVEVDRQYSYYDILFEDVSGLGSASDVRYNGLPVGQVVDLELDDADSSQVRVRIEIAADTPVNTETVAKLQSQGVTGVSFVGLSGGSEASAALPEGAVIPSERTALQSVFEGAPELLDRAVELLENINEVFDADNRAALRSTLDNLASASGRIDTVLNDFETLSGDLGSAARELAAFTDRLDTLADTAEKTLAVATDTFETANDTIATIGDFTSTSLVPLSEDLRTTTQTANRVIDDVGTRAAVVADRFVTFADDGTALIATADQTFANADVTLAAIYDAMEDASTTLASANKTFEMANQLIENDIGGIIADLRGAATAFTATVNATSASIDTVTEQVLAASVSAANLTASLEAVVRDNQRQLSEFVRLGLPSATAFTEEARSLVVNIERLVNKIERDPARFLLGTQNSRFRR